MVNSAMTPPALHFVPRSSIVTCGNPSLLLAGKGCQLSGERIHRGVRVLRCASATSHEGGSTTMDKTQHSGRRQTATERRRRELLEAAERIVLRDGPDASMNAIAAEAGITKPILYRHFGDKGGLYRALAVRHTDALLDNLRTALDAPVLRRDRVEATLDAYLVAIETRPQVYRFLMHPAEQQGQAESGFDVGRHSAPLLRRLGEEL